jgi:hypothetical protein
LVCKEKVYGFNCQLAQALKNLGGAKGHITALCYHPKPAVGETVALVLEVFC